MKNITYKFYQFKHWFFMWQLDDDNDITLTVCRFIHLTKYKEHTIIRFGKNKGCKQAPKFIRIN